jgi:hypothetical protein
MPSSRARWIKDAAASWEIALRLFGVPFRVRVRVRVRV